MAELVYEYRPISSPMALLFVRGIEVGWANGIQMREAIAKFPVPKLGSAFVQRYETVGVTYSGGFDYIHIKQLPITKQVGADGAALWPDPAANGASTDGEATNNMIDFPEMDIVLYDRLRSKPAFVLYGVSPTDRGINLGTNGVVAVTCGFVARRLIELPVT